jgi:hypothetical protein
LKQKTYAQSRQQELFQMLGTLARLQVNLETLARPRCSIGSHIVVHLTPLQQRVIDAAAYVLSDLSKAARSEIQNLPSKKNLKEKAKNELLG